VRSAPSASSGLGLGGLVASANALTSGFVDRVGRARRRARV